MIEPDSIINKVICGNALPILKEMSNEIIDCVMTSPPYWMLRDYGTATWESGDEDCDHLPSNNISKAKAGNTASGIGRQPYRDICGKCGAKRIDLQLGLEPTFQEYINNLCDIFDEVKRVLKHTGSCWVNLGDVYANTSTGGQGATGGRDKSRLKMPPIGTTPTKRNKQIVKEKCLCQIPGRFAIEMTNRGWILRNEIIWFKRNCMPSSANDRFTVDFEKLFFFTKNKEYYFEQQFEDLAHSTQNDYRVKNSDFTENRPNRDYAGYAQQGSGMLKPNEKGRNKRCVWDIPPKPCPDAHFAVYPKELCYTPIKACCPAHICKKCGQHRMKTYEKGEKIITGGKRKKQTPGISNPQEDTGYRPNIPTGYSDCGCGAGFDNGIVLDPFIGRGTTAMAAIDLKRNFVGIDLSPENVKLCERNINNVTPCLF